MPVEATFAVLLAAGLLSALVTGAVIGAATRLRVVDHPDDPRRLHQVATPRSGGLGIALVLLLAAALVSPAAPTRGWLLLAAVVAIAGIGLLDDLRALRALPKLLGQLLGAVFAALALPWPAAETWLGVAIAAGLVLACVNVWNFMDGSNGMASVQGLLLASCIAALGGGPWAWALAGACLGFLPFNFPKARIFLGDVGSHALGLGVAVLLLSSIAELRIGLPALLLLVSAFLLDAGWTLLLRLLRGEPFWRAHSQHVYQRLIRGGSGHARVCTAYAGWTALAIAATWACRGLPAQGQWLLVAGFYGAGSALYFMTIAWRPLASGAGSPK